MSATSTPAKNGKRKAESEFVDLTEEVDGTSVTVPTSSPLKKTKAATEPETPPRGASKTESKDSKTASPPKTTTSSKHQSKKATLKGEAKTEVHDAPVSSIPTASTPTRPNQSIAQGVSEATVSQVTASASGSLPGHSVDNNRSLPQEPEDDEDQSGEDYSIVDWSSEDSSSEDLSIEDQLVEDQSDEDQSDEEDDGIIKDPWTDEDYGWDGYDYDDDPNPFDGYDGPAPIGPGFSRLGLLNGRYSVTAPSVSQVSELFLVLTLGGPGLCHLWGKLELGVVSCILFFDERPRRATGDRLSFQWRGLTREDVVVGSDNNEGAAQFFGGGHVRFLLGHDGQDIIFDAFRVAGQGTRSEVSAREMQWEWNGYN